MDVRQTALSKMSKEELLDGLSKNELTITEYLKYSEKVDSQTKASLARSRDFLMMLYPEDPKHVSLLEYIKEYEHIWQFVYILHDRDVWTDDDDEVKNGEHVVGEAKKPHWHVLIHRKDQSSAGAQSKFFGVHVEKCSNVEGSLMYFVHKTPASIHKAQYDWDDLKGSKKLLDKVLIQKSHFVQLRYFLDLSRKGIPFAEMVMRVEDDHNLSVEEKNEYLAFALAHGALLVMSGNQCQYIDHKIAQTAAKAYRLSAVGAEELLRGDL